MTLLCPLARALHTNVNALLAFEQRLTREQLTAFSETFVRHVRDGRQREAQEDMARLLMEYPGDTALRLNCAALISVLEMSFPDESEETKAAWHEKRRALYEEAALSENVAERESASCALASMDLAEGRLDAAQARLDALPESREDTTLLRVRLLKKRGEDDRALEVVQKQLYRAVAQTLDKDVAESQLWVANQPAPAMPPAQSSVDEALKLLSEAKNPLMLVGKGAALAQAEDELREFVEKTDMPFQPMSMAKGVIPDDDPHCTASCRGLALRTADVVLLVGARLNWMLNFGEGKEWNPNVKFIQIDIDPNEIENARSIACPVVGDIKSAMQMINAGLEKTPVKASAQWLDMLKADAEKNDAKFAARVNSNTVPMGHYDALGAIKKVYDQHKDMILTNEGANTLDDCRNIIDIYQPRHRLDCGTWGVMGCAVGYSIGAAVATGKPVLYVGGDSGFGFDGMEVEVACRYNLPITFVVLNNGGIYRGDFENLGDDGDPSPLTLSYDAHYERMIEAFGGNGYYATTPAEVEQMVGEAVASGKPSLVHVQLAEYAGKESGHISNLNPKPVVGPLATSEMTANPSLTGAHM